MILIVSFEDNEHVRQVTKHLKSDYATVDVAWFPHKMHINAYAGADIDELYFGLPNGQRIELNSVSAVWYRRIRSMTLDPAITDETASTFAWSESNEACLP